MRVEKVRASQTAASISSTVTTTNIRKKVSSNPNRWAASRS